jgi:C-terminal processing protease CtpA/Prc
VDALDPHRATLTWRGETPVLSIPSHDPTHRGALDTLLAASADAIRRAPRLLIDLRGNEGGSSWVTREVVAMIASRPPRPVSEDEGEGQMLSSEDQIAYVRSRWQNVVRDSAAAERLIARMVAHPGALVPIEDSLDHAAAAARASSDAAPNDGAGGSTQPVAILVDRGTVSAAEAFLRQAQRSTRVTTFGEPTAGAIDYQSVSIVRIGDTGRRWYLGYPTITARADLPHGGIRGKGIAPDVRVDWARERDPIGAVIRRMAQP